jgi:hypothetical protein
MINNTNKVKGVEVLFTILFLVAVSTALHAQTSSSGNANSDMGAYSNSTSNNALMNNAQSNNSVTTGRY